MPDIILTHDKLLTIAVAASRRETTWKEKEVLWSGILRKISATHRTAETHKEYLAASKPRQSEIKDVGGFVGGSLANGKRSKQNVLCRSIITLDVDFPQSDTWDDFLLLYGNAAAIYSTHKHAPDAPRTRLIIPLDREVLPDEYEAIARRVASHLGIETFDSTTFQAERMMFWPSTSADGEYIFKYCDGPFLSADETLATYRDWRDASQWPTAMRDFEQVNRNIKKQGDPREKHGLIGAFCRCYSIEEAVDIFLQDVYDLTNHDNRYTYKHGSTFAGMITYENNFAYSHHGTDPISGKLCNAFDLVRIHKFGLRDEDSAPGTPTVKLPSYLAMYDFVAADTNVRLLMSREKQAETLRDFPLLADNPAVDNQASREPENDDWLALLEKDRKGNNKQTIHNAYTVLSNDPALKNCFGWDDFHGRKTVLKNLPWRIIDDNHRFVLDSDEAQLRKYFERRYEITTRGNILDALESYIADNTFHPVRNYLSGLKWDGVPRVDEVLIRYLGAANTDYVRTVTRKTLVAAVAGIMQPGIKFDYVLTLAGDEGKGKSTLARKLAGQWFSDSFTTVEGTKAMEQIQGCWIVEVGEMKALKRAEVQSVKAFVSKQEDIFRPAYGHNTIYPKRQCIFIGTTNEGEFLRGENGDRRFWVVDINAQQPAENIRDTGVLDEATRAQIWAEALHLYAEGEALYLTDEMEEQAKQQQQQHAEQDDRTGIIIEYLETKLPDGWEGLNTMERRQWLGTDINAKEPGIHERDKVCIVEIWCEALGYGLNTMNKYNTRDLHALMRSLPGWQQYDKGKARFGMYGVQKAYTRVDSIPNNKKYDNEQRQLHAGDTPAFI